MKFPKYLMESFRDRFSNRLDVYAKQMLRADRCGYETVYQPLTIEVIEAHLNGCITVGFYSLNLDNCSRSLCIDFDYESEDAHRLLNLFRSHGWRCLQEAKRSERDGHLWLFFDAPVSAVHLRRFAHEFLEKAAIPIQESRSVSKAGINLKAR